MSFRVAVEDRVRNDTTGEWEKSQTVFHDVLAFGKLAERAADTLRTGDAVIAQGEFRFRSYTDRDGQNRTGTSFVATRIGPDLLLADIQIQRDRDRDATRQTGRERPVTDVEVASPVL